MIKYSKNKKLNTLLQNIEQSLIDNLGINEIKRYYSEFKNCSDFNIVEYGNLLMYYVDVRELYIDSGYINTNINNMSDYKIWETYKRQVGYVVRRLMSEEV